MPDYLTMRSTAGATIIMPPMTRPITCHLFIVCLSPFAKDDRAARVFQPESLVKASPEFRQGKRGAGETQEVQITMDGPVSMFQG